MNPRDASTRADHIGRPTLIVADGDRGAREALRRILEPDHHVETAPCRDGLAEHLGRYRVDAVVLDLHLPGRPRGPWLAELKRAHPDVVWVGIAGDIDFDVARDLLGAGIAELLPKPFDVSDVRAAVTRALLAERQRGHLVGFLRALGRLVGNERPVDQILRAVEHDAPLRRQAGELLAWTSRRMVRVNRSREAVAVRGEGSAPGSEPMPAAPSAPPPAGRSASLGGMLR